MLAVLDLYKTFSIQFQSKASPPFEWHNVILTLFEMSHYSVVISWIQVMVSKPFIKIASTVLFVCVPVRTRAAATCPPTSVPSPRRWWTRPYGAQSADSSSPKTSTTCWTSSGKARTRPHLYTAPFCLLQNMTAPCMHS